MQRFCGKNQEIYRAGAGGCCLGLALHALRMAQSSGSGVIDVVVHERH